MSDHDEAETSAEVPLALPAQDEPNNNRPTRDRRPRRRRTLALGAIVVGLAVAATGAIVLSRSLAAPSDASAEQDVSVSTTPVTVGTMVAATNVKGTLHYAGDGALLAGPAGVLTMTPAPGTVVTAGGTLYKVNNLPVLLLRGDIPAWRKFELGMPEGDDVRQLEQNLTALGGFRGTPDAKFTQATADAIKVWQKALGVERTGSLERSVIHFAAGDMRIAQSTAALGTEIAPGAEISRATSTTKVVDLGLRLADQELAVVGAAIMIALPDGSETAGVIASVGQPTEQKADPASGQPGADSTFVIPVSITLNDPAATEKFAQASVTARFSTTLGADVLTVPVEALVAVDGDSFAVELPPRGTKRTERVTVTLGAFSSGRVAISGEGIVDGLEVVVPSL
ncbi:MAG: hypothetical protein RI885_1461 [Actinomycetota bacterium]|jgi:peptidoglycan hydrolase-like protein with peptidoglycan-binding domain